MSSTKGGDCQGPERSGDLPMVTQQGGSRLGIQLWVGLSPHLSGLLEGHPVPWKPACPTYRGKGVDSGSPSELDGLFVQPRGCAPGLKGNILEERSQGWPPETPRSSSKSLSRLGLGTSTTCMC